eukprot:TRINITY_DN21644_c0_g1_i1.p1 TRINITY_DN21644_c0_g1~~TRINITY_DN21644_c0_g1_i1.p1  ORF type:complete len:139 (-),score=63.77 TRINITY_DN21644_c0_g1_i1:470-886(-)
MDSVDDEMLKGHDEDEEEEDDEDDDEDNFDDDDDEEEEEKEKEVDGRDAGNVSISSSDVDVEEGLEQQSGDQVMKCELSEEVLQERVETPADAVYVCSDNKDPTGGRCIVEADLIVASVDPEGSSTEDTSENEMLNEE